ncbi:MAG: hypothetical protein SAJ12_15220 [Jaaginema sp. PMC 1079.18]|nr:hypothetical protein [Jaaginema sp. PMC 1080.18]MEC4852335.1 hypothetical protein [Jaaginema sp. PMC 1079.18]MEC4868947.1 hypothetical protein [Jaaginema sp. PMC 1078.18]
MATYTEILSQIQNLSASDRVRLFEELKATLPNPVEVEGTDEVISPEELAISDAAWQDYISGRDRGISSKELKRKLFGEHQSRD